MSGPSVMVGAGRMRCVDLHAIAHGAPVVLAPEARAAMAANVAAAPEGPSILEQKRRWLLGEQAEGLHADALARAFVLSHCAGVGDPLPVPAVRATMAARALALSQGLSGCRPEAAEVLLAMLNEGVHPTVPGQGSVGAAGDLAPMAHIARVACGYAGPQPGLPAFSPTGKEALSLINGVSLTTALAAIAVVRARRVLRAAVAACAMTMETVGAEFGCIDPARWRRAVIPALRWWARSSEPCWPAARRCPPTAGLTPSPSDARRACWGRRSRCSTMSSWWWSASSTV